MDYSYNDYNNYATVANAIELGANVLENVAGNDVSDTLGGMTLSHEELVSLVGAKFHSYLRNPAATKE